MISIKSEERPWGPFFVLDDEFAFIPKIIQVDPGRCLSYQKHHKRSETCTSVQGIKIITLNREIFEYSKAEIVLISRGVKHRFENRASEKLDFIEVEKGAHFGEENIVKIEDDYN